MLVVSRFCQATVPRPRPLPRLLWLYDDCTAAVAVFKLLEVFVAVAVTDVAATVAVDGVTDTDIDGAAVDVDVDVDVATAGTLFCTRFTSCSS